MKKTALALLLCGCIALSGCSALFDGHYESVRPHELQSGDEDAPMVAAEDYEQLLDALTDLVEDGVEESVISVAKYRRELIAEDVRRAVEQVQRENPIAAFAVETIRYELGTRGGTALAVEVEYIHDRTEIQKIGQVADMAEAGDAIAGSLNRCDAGIVLLVSEYQETDFVQLVENYAQEHPDLVMELPQVSVNIYPKSGESRVVELKYSYRTSRDSLKNMRNQVQPFFDAAVLYVSGDAEPGQKYVQLSSFLMERYDYQYATSITPTYSLLRHGVGDSKAFATVYAAMCRLADLECLVVSGTHNGESRYWNIICDEGTYYHIDLLTSGAKTWTDREMGNYVWDYSAYPKCG